VDVTGSAGDELARLLADQPAWLVRVLASLEAGRAAAGLVLVWDQTPEPAGEAVTSDSRPPFELGGDPLPEDVRRELVAFRRHCARCGRREVPQLLVRPRLAQLSFEIAEPTAVVPVDDVMFHGCGSCGRPLVGLALWATADYSSGAGVVVLALRTRVGGNLYSVRVWQDVDELRFFRSTELADHRWRDCERALMEYRLPVCVMAGCGEKARERFVVARRPDPDPLLPWSLCGRSWDPGEVIRLCPGHASMLVRGEDPARPGVLRDELVHGLRFQTAEASELAAAARRELVAERVRQWAALDITPDQVCRRLFGSGA